MGAGAKDSGPDYSLYADLLERYVTPDGVLYSDWKNSPADVENLNLVLESFAKVDRFALNRAEAMAFLVNVYNAAMIDAVLEHYPLDSVRSIGFLPFSVFRQKNISLQDREVSLDIIEKEILLEEYGDPRIHFAVNCASVSCPPLRSEPFTEAALEKQFDEQATLFANSPHAALVLEGEGATRYSELFNWYDDDFPGEDPAHYLNQFRTDPLPLGNQVRWIDYDWSLNEAGASSDDS